MTLNMPEQEMAALNEASSEMGVNKTYLVRQAIKMRLQFDAKIKAGWGFSWKDPQGVMAVTGCGWEGMD